MKSLPVEVTNESAYYLDHGRRFNARVRYVLPSDEGGMYLIRLLEQHFCFKISRNGNFLAPVKRQLEEGIQVLDSACGYGASWTIDMAKEYPNSHIFGVDISDGFPSKNESPSNTTFVLGNIAVKIPLPDNSLDFVFQRLLIAALSSDEWDSNLKEIYRVLKPGGFIESSEYNYEVQNAGPLYKTFLERVFQAFKNIGLVVNISLELNDRMEKIGYVNRVTTARDFPLNHGQNGEANWRSFGGGFKAMGPLLAKVFTEWEDRSIYEKYMDNVGEELTEYKSYIRVYTTYAQKP